MRSFKISVVKVLALFVAMLMLGTSTFAQVSVTLPTVSGAAGTTGTGAITVGDLTGKNVTAFQFTLYYDKNVIDITGATAGALLGDNQPTVNADLTNGKITVAWASATALAGSGTLVNLQISFKAGGQTALNFNAPGSFMFNAGNPTNTVTAGNVVVPAIVFTGVPTTGIRAGQTIKIPVNVSQITDPNNVLSYNFSVTFDPAVINLTNVDLVGTKSEGWTAAVNPATGQLTIACAGASRITAAAGSTLLYLTGTAVAAGSSNVAFSPITINAGNPLAGGNNFTVTVAAANVAPVATITPVGPNFTISDGTPLTITLSATDANPEDVASLVYAATGLPTGATFVNKVFSWTPTLAQRSATAYVVKFSVTDQGGLKSEITVNITVTQNYAPTLTLSVTGAQTVKENETLTFNLIGADQNPSDVASLKYSITAPSPVPTGAAVSAAGVFTWKPNYDQGRTAPYAFTFTVTDQGGLTGTASINITVVDVPRAPVFTKEIPYTVVPVVVVDPKWANPGPPPYTFTYLANSPEGKPVVFSLVAGPNGSQITYDGVFSWLPTKDQAGKVYTLTVQVSDGTLTALSTQLIAASTTITGVEKYSGVPTEYSLFQNYPNPFNPTTAIQVALPKEGNVKLTVYNILGEEVAVLANKHMSAGYHTFNFDASKLTSGMYLYRIEANDFVSVRKMLLIK